MAPRVRWIHSRSAGLEDLLFPALVDSAVPVTNARGVFSRVTGDRDAIKQLLLFLEHLHCSLMTFCGPWKHLLLE